MVDIHWFPAIAGGLLIGAAVALLYTGTGRMAGISGITFTAVFERGHRGWRLLFIAGLLAGAWLALPMAAAAGVTLSPAPAFALPGLLLFAGAGLLAGLGTRLSGGCTSGHGVCGTARLSPRSLAATAVFMLLGMLVATLLRPLLAG